jgi:hypothetical protein
LIKPFSLKKDDIIFGKAIEKLNILFEGSGIKSHRCVHPVGLQIRHILEHTVTAGSNVPPLDEEKNFHFTSP